MRDSIKHPVQLLRGLCYICCFLYIVIKLQSTMPKVLSCSSNIYRTFVMDIGVAGWFYLYVPWIQWLRKRPILRALEMLFWILPTALFVVGTVTPYRFFAPPCLLCLAIISGYYTFEKFMVPLDSICQLVDSTTARAKHIFVVMHILGILILFTVCFCPLFKLYLKEADCEKLIQTMFFLLFEYGGVYIALRLRRSSIFIVRGFQGNIEIVTYTWAMFMMILWNTYPFNWFGVALGINFMSALAHGLKSNIVVSSKQIDNG